MGSCIAGLEAGTECCCGNEVTNEWTENQGDCNIPCPGNATQICGGASVFNVFEAETQNTLRPPSTPTGGISTTTASTSNPVTPATKTTSTTTKSTQATATATWQAVGCYAEQSDRVLRNKISVPGGEGNNTRQNCIGSCDRNGYSYAGVENALECWCDNVINPPGALAPDGTAGW